MTYNVSSGTLNSTILYNPLLCGFNVAIKGLKFRCKTI